MGEYVQVQSSISSREKGLEIARSLIEARLAACAQVVGPMISTYRWKGEVQVDEEYLLLIKTPAERYADVEACSRPLRGALLALAELGDMPWVARHCSGQSPNADAPFGHELTKCLAE